MSDGRFRPWFLLLLFIVMATTATACAAPSGADSAADDEAATIRIAEEYRRDGDIQKAAAQLAALKVPNERQFLALLTEQYITEGRNAAVTANLVLLSRDLGMVTALIAQYGEPTAAVEASPEPTPTLVVSASAQDDGTAMTATDIPTATPEPMTVTPAPPTATPTSAAPRVRADRTVNLRAGPGTDHPVVSAMQASDELPIIGRNADGSWWQVCCVGQQPAWVAASVVAGLGGVQTVALASSIPTPPPTPTPRPTQSAPPPAQAPSRPAVDFRIIEQRMLSNIENGGSFDGDSLHCGLGHTIYVRVVDAGGNSLDGIIVRGIYYGDLPVTGTKGPGRTEENLFAGGGDELVVERDAAGRTYASEKTRPLLNRTRDIPIADYIAGGYCRDEAECQQKINNNQLCEGHYSWSVVFQRTW